MQKKLQSIAVVLIFGVLIFLRFWRLDQPSELYFDEIYHIQAARQVVNHDTQLYEWWHLKSDGGDNFDWLHPPLVKYVQAFSIILLGDNALTWRIGSAIFGVGVILAVYLLAQELFKNKKLSLIAVFLVACDGLVLVQSRIAMNDIYVTFFILLIFLFYLKFIKQRNNASNLWLLITGISMGLALATKWSALLPIVFIWCYELICLFKNKNIINKLPWRLFSLVILPLAIYILFFLPIFLQGKNLSFFRDLHQNIIWYQFNRDGYHSYKSAPIEWFLNLRPVWYYKGLVSKQIEANIYALGNPLIFILGFFAVIFSLFLKNKNKLLKFLLLSYFSLWLPWLISPRIMFFYHYTPAVPLLCILISYWFIKIYKKNIFLLYFLLLIIFLIFIIYYPHWTGLSVPKSFAEAVYFILPSWK